MADLLAESFSSSMNLVAIHDFAYYEYYLMKFEENIFSRSDHQLSIGILVMPQSNMLSLASCIDPLRAANRRAGKQVFSWQLLSPSGGEVILTSGIGFGTEPLKTRPNYDVLILVAGFNLTELATPSFLRQLRTIAPRMQAIGGVDGGSWLLARSGLLNGQTATTHWEDLEEFAEVFPKINAVRDRFIISGKYFTTGGAAPAIDMMLHLIQTRHGARLAEAVASAFIYDAVKSPASPQVSISTARLQKTSLKVAHAVEIMSASLEEPQTISAIARQIGLSARGLELLFGKEIGQSPGAFFLGLRLHEARRLAMDTALAVQTIALRTGFTSQAVFARAFRREFAVSVRELRKSHR
ncbi:MAG: transcriptional regulator GlxA family with amidase domain [Paracoccaceae bacterium]|jgi:transcriptional regulator GlxA family with amidase domain